jgi:hypothetical protein
MKDINELNERMDSTDEIIDNLVKKTTELEKQAANVPELNIPDYTASFGKIMEALKEIKTIVKKDEDLNLLNVISEKLDRLPKASHKQIRLLLFPETNQGQYYKIVFGRLIPWGLAFVALTYIFITGYRALELYRYKSGYESTEQCNHYRRAWLYLQLHSKKKMLSAMDEAYNKTADK